MGRPYSAHSGAAGPALRIRLAALLLHGRPRGGSASAKGGGRPGRKDARAAGPGESAGGVPRPPLPGCAVVGPGPLVCAHLGRVDASGHEAASAAQSHGRFQVVSIKRKIYYKTDEGVL
jgi:hypothetical protein